MLVTSLRPHRCVARVIAALAFSQRSRHRYVRILAAPPSSHCSRARCARALAVPPALALLALLRCSRPCCARALAMLASSLRSRSRCTPALAAFAPARCACHRRACVLTFATSSLCSRPPRCARIRARFSEVLSICLFLFLPLSSLYIHVASVLLQQVVPAKIQSGNIFLVFSQLLCFSSLPSPPSIYW